MAEAHNQDGDVDIVVVEHGQQMSSREALRSSTMLRRARHVSRFRPTAYCGRINDRPIPLAMYDEMVARSPSINCRTDSDAGETFDNLDFRRGRSKAPWSPG